MIIDSIGSTSSSSMSFVDISIFWDVVDPAVIVKGLWVIEYSSCFADPDTANGMLMFLLDELSILAVRIILFSEFSVIWSEL